MRAVIFDLDGTLLHFTCGYRELLADAFRDATGRVSNSDLERYDEAFYEHLQDFDPKPVELAFQTVRPDGDAAEFANSLLAREIEATEPPDGIADDLARLAEDFQLGVLTNGVPDWQRRKLRAHGLEEYFSALVASYEAGAHKPDRAPFRLAEQRLSAEAYAMVGDDDVDIEGATNSGWVAHRYSGDGFGDLPAVFGWK